MKLASFDIEIAKDLPGNFDTWEYFAPLGITCAAVALSDRDEVKYWSGFPQLSMDQCVELVHDLQSLVNEGYSLLAWNGTGFDFHVLAQESKLYRECGALALNHIDMMLLVTFEKGWYLSLQKALTGAGLEGKLKSVTLSDGVEIPDMDGSKAPRLWAAGEQKAVLEYLRQDVVQPLRLAEDIQRTGSIRWTSNNGKPQFARVERLRTVLECFEIPEPDVSWMTNPPTREQFVSWIPNYKALIQDKRPPSND
ncbi:MAG: ribonuclease H-like domain-containing protein [Candidatus Brocadiaceae bacterium]|nr:ribonuclease H-like domain-containing protein [Candidatus Brocadiaceae bacterium]